MLRYAFSAGLAVALASTASATAPPSVPSTHPQGQERSPAERDHYLPVLTPAHYADVAGTPKAVGPGDSAAAQRFLRFPPPLGFATSAWPVRSGT